VCTQAETVDFVLNCMLSELARFLDSGTIALLPKYTTCKQHGMFVRDGMLFRPIARVGDRLS
jgi:hypothetical protein